MITSSSIEVLNRIKGQLYLSNASPSKNLSLLRSNSITHVLICCSEIAPSFPDKLVYKKLNIKETFDFNISSFFDEAYEFIESGLASGGGVLVHCVQGQSRSPTIVISYLMRRFNLSYTKSLKIVKKKHKITDPNVGFIEQLKQYETKVQENSSMTCSACKCAIQ